MKRSSQFTPALAPRGLSRTEAAEYIGVGASLFDRLVADGRMPAPKRIDGRRVWDRIKLDVAFSHLPGDEDADEHHDNPWKAFEAAVL